MDDPSRVPPPPTAPLPPVSAGSPAAGPRRPHLPGWVLPAALGVALVATAVTGTFAFTQRQEVGRLRVALAEAEARIAELEARLADGEDGGGLEGLLDELFGEGGGDLEGLLEGGLDGLLDGLLEGTGGFDDLLGGTGGPDIGACLAGGGLGGLLGDSDPIVADDLTAQVGAIADRVEALRGLQLRAPVEPELLGDEAFTARVTELVGREYTVEDADHDRRVLAALGAVDEGDDLRALHLDLVGEQAAGFYDSETGQLVVRADDAAALLGPAGQVVMAHEIEHAVADQNLGLPVDADEPGDDDAARASLALVEGGATLLMQQFALGALDLGEQLALATDPSLAASQEQIADYPEFLQREIVFPYTEGMGFVCALHAEGGWPAVDAAYADLPAATAHVLWPERYAAGEGPAAVAGLGAPGGSWEQARSDTFGAAELLWLFSAPGDDAEAALDDPRGRAAAWAGGQVQLWTDGPASAVGLSLSERAGERDLCESVTSWYTAAFPDGRAADTTGDEALAVTAPSQDAVVVCAGDAVRVGVAPDLTTARAVAG